MHKRVFKVVAVGGTFDQLHRGHKALLSMAFEVGEEVLIGVTSDEFAERLGKNPSNRYEVRVKVLENFLEKEFSGRRYEISALDDYFGEPVYRESVEALVASEETIDRIEIANKIRIERGLKPLVPVIVKLVLAENGRPISTTRIRLGEIDVEGRVLKPS